VDALPTISSFTTNAWSVPAGAPVTLTAVFSNGTGGTAVINPGGIDISSGSVTVTPTAPTTYTLVVKNSASTPAATSPTLRIVAGNLAVVAGNPSGFGEVDGAGTNARFSFPAGIAFDSSSHNLFVVDQGGYNLALGGTIRALTPNSTVTSPAAVATYTGLPGMLYWQDGIPSTSLLSTSALFNYAYGIAADGHGNFYVADTNNSVIRMIDASGNVSTLAGTPGTASYSSSTFNKPYGVAAYFPTDALNGVVYVSDGGNLLIRAVTVSGGNASAIIDVAGTPGMQGTSNTGSGTFTYPVGICLGSGGTVIYVADGGAASNVRALTLSGPSATTLAAGPTPAPLATLATTGLSDPLDVTVGPGNLVYVADSENNRIAVVDPTSTLATTYIYGSNPTFNTPTHVASDGTNLYVADSGNNAIQIVTTPNTSPAATLIAGKPSVMGHADLTGTNATFMDPSGLAIGPISHNVYVADRVSSAIRTVTPLGVVTLFAGSEGGSGYLDGPTANATFNSPLGVAVDAQENVFVADTGNHAVRLISAGNTYTIAIKTADPLSATNPLYSPAALAVDASDNVYVADKDTNVVVKLTPPANGITAAGWTMTVLSGQVGTPGYFEGTTGASALFMTPRGLVFDGNNTLYLADAGANNVRTVNILTGATSLVAGSTTPVSFIPGTATTPGFQDGIGPGALFNNPMSLAIDTTAGFLFVADTNNAAVRRITLSSQEVDTLIGSTTTPVLQIGGTTMPAGLPSDAVCQGIAADGSGNLYLAADDVILTAPY
jgi:DNA-binding beta-propeller fold protein YncE